VRPARAGAVRLGHADVDPVGFDEALTAIARPASQRTSPLLVVTPNIAHIAMLERDPGLQDAYARAGLVLADGWPVAAAPRGSAGSTCRASRADLLPAVLARAAAGCVALVGAEGAPSRQRAAELRAGRARRGPASPSGRGRPMPSVSRRCCPRAWTSSCWARRPKQELLVAAGLRAGVLPPAAYLCFGAAIDFVAGVVDRAPQRWQRWHLEWAHRVVHEPRRLAGRYLVAAPRFAAVVVRERRAQ
jgi:UDP-N-acetyl-D-mannosaminuronic acid transferase (WecB/TagA/CpsF family)